MTEAKGEERDPTDPGLIAAKIEQAKAEAELARAEAERAHKETAATVKKLEAEAAKTLAEARERIANAEEYELRLVKARNDADREAEKRSRERTSDVYHHRYPFTGPVTEESVKRCIEQLDFWDRTEDPSKFELVFYSPGGSVLAGMALFDHILALRSKGWHVTTIARGYAASMGAILLQAGDVRVCGPESYLLIHEVSTGAIGKLSDLEDEVAFAQRITNRVVDIFAKRSKLSAAVIRRKMKREWWLDSAESLKSGIVDDVR